jgi:hypothetical protein
VPAGFECDGQSWFIGETKALLAALLHDWLYSHCGKIAEGTFTRRQADAIFRKALIASGVNRVSAWTRWSGLRIGGGKAWREHQERINREKDQLHFAL